MTNKLDNLINKTADDPVVSKVNSAAEELMLVRIRAELNASCDALDGSTLSRLNRIRHTALEQKSRSRNPLLLPFGGLITACVLVLSVMLLDRQSIPEPVPSAATALEDIEILSSAEELDFYENYEFYQWLADNGTSI